MSDLRSEFSLDPDIAFLNHGSFGAIPNTVMDEVSALYKRIAANPVSFFDPIRAGEGVFNQNSELSHVRRLLGDRLHADPMDIVGVTNASNAMNSALRSLPFEKGDEIVTTDHEYGAVMKLLELVCRDTGAVVKVVDIPTDLSSAEEFTDRIVDAFSERTKAMVISVITSPTALHFPVAEIVREARERNIWSILDGAHVPGLVPFSIRDVDPDIFAGNCHKWMMAANGAGFLYVRRDLQDAIEPTVLSNGWLDVTTDRSNQGPFGNSRYVDRMGFPGTPDVIPLLTVRAACDFVERTGWLSLCRTSAEVLEDWAQELVAELDLPRLAPRKMRAPQLVSLDLRVERKDLQARLFNTYGIEIPVIPFKARSFIRASFQPYNDQSDLDRLTKALRAEL